MYLKYSYTQLRNIGIVTLIKESWTVPEQIILPNDNPIVPFFAGETVNWKVKTA